MIINKINGSSFVTYKRKNYNNLKNVYKPTERCTDESKEITTSTINIISII